jgi:hypothetical protein
MRTLDTEKVAAESRTSTSAAAPGGGTLQSPRAMMTAAAVPVRQCSTGAGPILRQQVPVSCSSVPVFRQVSSDLRSLGPPQSPNGDGAFTLTKDSGGGPPPPSGQGQVFRRYSGNGGITSPRVGTGAAASMSSNALTGGVPAPSLQPSALGGATQATAPGRTTPQRLFPTHAGGATGWGSQFPPGTLSSMATMQSGMLLPTTTMRSA